MEQHNEIVQLVGSSIQDCDPDRKLEDVEFHAIIEDITFKVARSMGDTGRTEVNDEDRKFVEHHVRKLVLGRLLKANHGSRKPRFEKLERVVCNVGCEWVCGCVLAVNEPDPEDQNVVYPYVVKVDPPVNQPISVPFDSHDIVRPEVCFGQSADGLQLTLFCLPQIKSKARRFQVGERVACAVENSVAAPTGTMWAAGTITEVDISMEQAAEKELPEVIADKWPRGVPSVPYLVHLDAGCPVLVHKDEHWLLRDLELVGGGSRHKRMEVCQRNGSWETVDHVTRRVRPCEPPDQ